MKTGKMYYVQCEGKCRLFSMVTRTLLAWGELKVLIYTLLSENNVCAHGSGATIAPTKPANSTRVTPVKPANGTTIIPIESTNITKDDSISGKYTTLRM